jgi:TPR repeat protein
MKNLTATICLTISVLFGTAEVSSSADFEKGYIAFQSGEYATALREWRPLAEQGDAFTQYNLGQMYRKGKGVLQDYKTAVKWYTLAAEQGYADAQFNLGVMCDNGEGIPQDNKTAVKWWKLAAEQGDADAQSNLGVMYGMGKGVIQDYIYAHIWLSIAASSGEGGNASKNREIITKRMSPAQLETAKKLARKCVRKIFKGC